MERGAPSSWWSESVTDRGRTPAFFGAARKRSDMLRNARHYSAIRGSNLGITKLRRSPEKDRKKSEDCWPSSNAQGNSPNHDKLIAFWGQESHFLLI